MEEELLTKEEIESIQQEAKDPKYQIPNLLHHGSKRTSIFRISLETGLILIHGDEWTGMKHIDHRHSPNSRNHWKESGKLDDPSKFHLNLPPMRYLAVADQIYGPNNLNHKDNKHENLFELYEGKATIDHLKETNYRLLVYKNTRIIHTFFVHERGRPFNKKKVLDLRQGWTSSSTDLLTDIDTFLIPYFNQKDVERFKVILRTDKINATDNWFIQMNDEKGRPVLTNRIRVDHIESIIRVPYRLSVLDYSDLTWIEKIIKQMISGRYEEF